MATTIIPEIKEINVPIKVGIKISAGLAAPFAIRKAITEVGIRVMPAVLSTRNIIWALLAVSFSGFNSCNSFIAFKPTGVAALSRPSILAEKFIIIDPLAGWFLGTPGKSLLKKGATPLANKVIIPALSPIFMMPSQKVMIPIRPKEISAPVLALSNIPFTTLIKMLVSPKKMSLISATTKAIRKKAIQT